MSLNPSTSSSFPLGFTIFPPLFSSRRYRPCPGLSARPAPHTITPGGEKGGRRESGLIGRSERSKRWGTTDRREEECRDEEGDREVAGRDEGVGGKEDEVEGSMLREV